MINRSEDSEANPDPSGAEAPIADQTPAYEYADSPWFAHLTPELRAEIDRLDLQPGKSIDDGIERFDSKGRPINSADFSDWEPYPPKELNPPGWIDVAERMYREHPDA